uniref:F-box domain-containing protein n=1 Tax=Steinernema glaseri TaxID=37863 RepID=A0A1I7YBD6_9BILA
MDHLPFDRVEEIANFLPRKDVGTIARVAARSPGLENWSVVSDDQLERRVLLEVCVHLQGFKHKENEEEKSPRIRISVQKLLSDGSREEWDFKNWRYAWIHTLYITASPREEPLDTVAPKRAFKESDVRQAMSLVSLPVDPSVRTRLSIATECAGEGELPDKLVDLFWDTVEETQKGFVDVSATGDDVDVALESFVAYCIEQGAFLEELSYYNSLEGDEGHAVVYNAVASLFGETRGRPLYVYLEGLVLDFDYIEIVIDDWLLSDGIYEMKTVEGANHMFGEEQHEKWEDMLSAIGDNEIRVVKFEPWHVPVDLKWIDALIKNWREGCGFYVWRGEGNFSFRLKKNRYWKKLVEEHGPAVERKEQLVLSIAHPKSPIFLEVRKSETQFEIGVKHEFYTKNKMKKFISDWKKGNRDTLLNGLTKIEVQMDCERFPLPQKHSHPLVNACLKISKRVYRHVLETVAVRMSIVPIDPKNVEDWNLELLFGSLQV